MLPLTLHFRPGRDGLIARHPDGKIILPARGERVERGQPYVAASLRPTASGRAYFADGLRLGEWSAGDPDLELPEHVHSRDCRVCAAEKQRRDSLPCPACGQPLGDWRQSTCRRGLCLHCYEQQVEAERQAAVEAARPAIFSWRERFLARALEIPEAPTTPGAHFSGWRHEGEYRSAPYLSSDERGHRVDTYTIVAAEFSCGHTYSGRQPSHDACPVCVQVIAARLLAVARSEALASAQREVQRLSDDGLIQVAVDESQGDAIRVVLALERHFIATAERHLCVQREAALRSAGALPALPDWAEYVVDMISVHYYMGSSNCYSASEAEYLVCRHAGLLPAQPAGKEKIGRWSLPTGAWAVAEAH